MAAEVSALRDSSVNITAIEEAGIKQLTSQLKKQAQVGDFFAIFFVKFA